MNKHTRENPGCYHSMLKYLAEIDNLSQHVIDRFDKIEQLYSIPKNSKTKKTHLKYKSYNIHVIDKQDKEHQFMGLHGQRFDKTEQIEVSHFNCFRLRQLSEFTTKPTVIGKYKDSLGGGWYSMCTLYQINNQFFVDMECTCS